MVPGLKPLRRVVTGNDREGRSRVILDGPAPRTNIFKSKHSEPDPDNLRGHTDLWVWEKTPLPLKGSDDASFIPYEFPGPVGGGHFRVIQGPRRPDNYDRAKDDQYEPEHEVSVRPSGRSWDRGIHDAFTTGMHKTETVDYGIMLEGEREIHLDDRKLLMKPGDIVIQVGAWHNWSAPLGCRMAFDMIGAKFVDGPQGLGQGSDKVITGNLGQPLPAGAKATRRIVTIDREPGKSVVLADGPTPDVRIDPARPGFAAERQWVVDGAPAKIVFETLHLPHTIEPPKAGSVCRVYTIPPDSVWQGKVSQAEVEAYFRSMGSPGASTWSKDASHPYMQKTSTVDFCIVLEGEPTLVLDTTTVPLKPIDIVIQRGTNHAWSNPTSSPCRIVVASHDAV